MYTLQNETKKKTTKNQNLSQDTSTVHLPMCQAETGTRNWEGGSKGRTLCTASEAPLTPSQRCWHQMCSLTQPADSYSANMSQGRPMALKPHSQAFQITVQAALPRLPSVESCREQQHVPVTESRALVGRAF